MKIDRLIGILSVLLQKGSVTAPELAEMFEVSRRTINRDIEDLCMAGIPVATRQGSGGGISILDGYTLQDCPDKTSVCKTGASGGYKLGRTVLSKTEMKDILAGLRSLDSVHGTNRYGQLMEKLSAGSSDFLQGDQSILIDLSSWYKDTLAPKIAVIRDAIERGRELEFLYYAPSGESVRRIEPYYLMFRWSSWYVWGYCQIRNDFRLFKLNRMEQVVQNGNAFLKRSAPLPNLKQEQIFPGGISVEALFEASCKWRLVEEFGLGCLREREDGRLVFHAEYTNEENLFSWLLNFGDRVCLLKPKHLREKMKRMIERMQNNYQER